MRNAAPERAALTAIPPPDAALVARFSAALDALHAIGPDDRLGVAVSGGPDSLALLLLAGTALPGRVEAATIDHGLRPESAEEAMMVAAVCARLGVPHHVARGSWCDAAGIGVQAAARQYRYGQLARWCGARGLTILATAHHADDQGETLLMRLARGSGVGGLAGVRSSVSLDGRHDPDPARTARTGRGTIRLVRPLLGFRKHELVAIVAAAGVVAADDPSNDSDHFDRTRARRLLRDVDWLDPVRLAAVAGHLAAADDALTWAACQEFDRRVSKDEGERPESGDDEWLLDPCGLPDEILRRLIACVLHMVEDYAVAGYSGPAPDGPKLARFIHRLQRGRSATLWHVLARPGRHWRFMVAPPRRA